VDQPDVVRRERDFVDVFQVSNGDIEQRHGVSTWLFVKRFDFGREARVVAGDDQDLVADFELGRLRDHRRSSFHEGWSASLRRTPREGERGKKVDYPATPILARICSRTWLIPVGRNRMNASKMPGECTKE